MAWPVVAGIGATIGAGLWGAREGRKAAQDANNANRAMQEEFAQHGIRWRIADAKAANIHPIYALGAQLPQVSPSYIADDSMAHAIPQMGQDISRAIAAGSTAQERKLAELNLENAALQNEYMRARIASERRLSSQTGPAFPSNTVDPYLTGQGDTSRVTGMDPRVIDEPLRRTVSDPGDPSKEAGAIPDYNLARTSGGYAVVPAADIKQRIEDDWLAEQQWKIRAYKNVLTGRIRLPDGRRAIVNPLTGELIPISGFTEEVLEKFMDGPGRIWKSRRGRN